MSCDGAGATMQRGAVEGCEGDGQGWGSMAHTRGLAPSMAHTRGPHSWPTPVAHTRGPHSWPCPLSCVLLAPT